MMVKIGREDSTNHCNEYLIYSRRLLRRRALKIFPVKGNAFLRGARAGRSLSTLFCRPHSKHCAFSARKRCFRLASIVHATGGPAKMKNVRLCSRISRIIPAINQYRFHNVALMDDNNCNSTTVYNKFPHNRYLHVRYNDKRL